MSHPSHNDLNKAGDDTAGGGEEDEGEGEVAAWGRGGRGTTGIELENPDLTATSTYTKFETI